VKFPVLHGAVGGTLLLAAACAVGPNHKRPEVATPDVHRGDEQQKALKPDESATTFADLPWWRVFRDPSLSSLINEASQKAYDVRIAMARVEAARQQYLAAGWALAPTIGIWGGAGSAVGTSTVPSIYPLVHLTGNFGAGINASWEPDVWGRLRRASEVQREGFEAAGDDRRAVHISLIGDVAETYFLLLSLDQQKTYALQAVATRRDTMTFFTQRATGGVGNQLEVLRATASLKQAEAALTRVDLEIANGENGLSFLTARVPGPIQRNVALDALAAPPAVPNGLPSSLLERRPDIRAAEHRLAGANAQVGMEKADFFPKFDLTGFAGVASHDLQQASFARGGGGLFTWTLPVLGGQRVQAEWKAAKANWEAATAQYERVAVNAFREVANALASIRTLAQRRVALDAQLAALEQSQTVAIERYRGGVANYLDVLTAQESLFVTQLDMADLKGQQQIAIARLYRVLGGGWPTPEKQPEQQEAKK
jgi:outer membrane protein, multidrug efflux system